MSESIKIFFIFISLLLILKTLIIEKNYSTIIIKKR